MPQSLMVRRMNAMHTKWELQYMETPFPVQPILAHLAKPEPNASLKVPILSKTTPSHVTNLMF